MWKRLLLIRGAELLMFAVLAAVPLAVLNPYALGLLTLLAIYGILLIGLIGYSILRIAAQSPGGYYTSSRDQNRGNPIPFVLLGLGPDAP